MADKDVLNLKGGQADIIELTDVVKAYYKDVQNYKLLSSDEEQRLLEVTRTGTKKEVAEAEKNLLMSNQRFIISAARLYANRSNLSDLISEANIGFLEAIRKFDPTKGTKLISFAAHYIKRAVYAYKVYKEPNIRKTNISKTQYLVSRVTSKFVQENQREPTPFELMTILNEQHGCDIRDENDVATLSMISIERTWEDEHDDRKNKSSNDGSCDEYSRRTCSFNDYERISDHEHDKKLVSRLLSTLKPIDRKITEMMFGLNGHQPDMTNKTIGEIVGLTPERIRQKRKEIIRKFQKLTSSKKTEP